MTYAQLGLRAAVAAGMAVACLYVYQIGYTREMILERSGPWGDIAFVFVILPPLILGTVHQVEARLLSMVETVSAGGTAPLERRATQFITGTSSKPERTLELLEWARQQRDEDPSRAVTAHDIASMLERAVGEALPTPLEPAEARLRDVESFSATWLEAYHDRTRSRATQSFWAAVLSGAAGFGVLGWVVVRLVGRDVTDSRELLALGILGSASAALSGFLVRTLMRVHEVSLTQLNRFFDHPAGMNSLMVAWRMAQTLSEDDPGRPTAFAAIIKRMSDNLPTRVQRDEGDQ